MSALSLKEIVANPPPVEAVQCLICKQDCPHFIQHFVQIEDRDTLGLAIPFALWPKQEEALQSFLDHRLTISLKARQLGLTWLALSYALWRMLLSPGYYVWAFHPWAEEIWSAAYPTINRPTGGQVIGLSTMARATLFEEVWRAAGKDENSFERIFLPWNADPRRDPGWRESTKRDLPATWRQEYPETEEEAMSAGADTALPEFSARSMCAHPS